MRPTKNLPTNATDGTANLLLITETESYSESELNFIYRYQQIWKDCHLTGAYSFECVSYTSVGSIVGTALRLYIVSMRGEASHKQELASRWFSSFTHTAPGRYNEPSTIYPIGELGSAS